MKQVTLENLKDTIHINAIEFGTMIIFTKNGVSKNCMIWSSDGISQEVIQPEGTPYIIKDNKLLRVVTGDLIQYGTLRGDTPIFVKRGCKMIGMIQYLPEGYRVVLGISSIDTTYALERDCIEQGIKDGLTFWVN